VNLVNTLVQNLSYVLSVVGELQKMGKLDFEYQSLQQESYILYVQDILIVVYGARLIVDYHAQLKCLCVIAGQLGVGRCGAFPLWCCLLV